LTIPTVLVGDKVYTSVVITVGEVKEINNGLASKGYDVYDSTNNLLSISSVNVNGSIYSNVLISVKDVLEVGNSKVNQPAILYETSYKNFKLNGSDSIIYPIYHLRYGGNPLAIGFGDFLKSGELSVFVAYQNYDPSTDQLSTIQSNPTDYSSEFVFYTINADNSLTKSISMKNGCLHPRKAIIADFNKDDIPDVFVACHGYDNVPFPGEKSNLLLSNGRGNYVKSESLDVAFTHGASAADINGDGYPDLIRTTGGTIDVFINQKDGTFIRKLDAISDNNVLGYYNVELFDVDADGYIDIISGGNDWDKNGSLPSKTKIWYGNVDGSFGNRTSTLPPIPGRGVVNDFTIIKKGNETLIYVNRTSDSSTLGGWYNGMAIQSFNLSSLTSNLIADDQTTSWVAWLLPKLKGTSQGVGPFNSNGFFQ
jgi:hypothetical protein